MIQRYIVIRSTALAILALVLLAPSATTAQTPTVVDICSRTAEVQTVILATVAGATCSTTTAAQLAGITRLEISAYSGTTLLRSDFAGLTGLMRLSVNDSPTLATVPANAVADLTSLVSLSLRGNSIASLHADSFSGLTMLETLRLNQNSIASLPSDLFDGLTMLKYLYLNQNSITSLDEDLFDGLTSLDILNMSENSITSLPEDLFDGLAMLTLIDMSENSITSLHEDIFDGLTMLDTISMSENALTSLPENLFDGLTMLEFLFLYDNAITSLHEDVFDGLAGLVALHMGANAIATLPVDLFDPLGESLLRLYLSDNSFTDLPDGIFDGLTGLDQLYLGCSHLTALNLDRFTPFATTLTHLDIRRNGFSTPSDIRTRLTMLRSQFFLQGDVGPRCEGDALDTLVYFEEVAYLVTEGRRFGNPIVRVRLSAGPAPGDTVTIPITVSNQGGATDADYTGVPASMTFGPLQDALAVTLVPVDDTDDDDGESVELGFGTLPSGAQPGTPRTTTVSIGDNDGPGVSLSKVVLEAEEEARFPGTYTVELGTEPTADVTITPTILSGSGFTLSPATLTFTTGMYWDDYLTVTVTATVDDDLMDHTGVISHTVTSTDMNYNALTIPNVHVTVIDNDEPPATVSFGSATYNATEGSSVTVTLTLSAAPATSVVIPITATNQDGATNDDYSVGAGVDFAAGVQSASFNFTAFDDTADDDGESVVLSFGTLPSGYSAGSTATTTVSIVDNDAAPNNQPEFSSDTATRSVAENTASGMAIGAAVVATDDDDDTLTYTLSGTDASSFIIVSTSGQIQTSSSLNFESTASYSVDVNVRDSKDSAGDADTDTDDTIAVTITLTNVDEAGTVSITGTLSGGEELTASVSDIDGDVTSASWRWARGNTPTAFTNISGATSASYTLLASDVTKYLRATVSYTDPQGSGKSANAVTGQIGASNSEPEFPSTETGARSVAENSPAGTNVGLAVTATDDDGDTLTYSLTGTDSSSFTFNTATGQIQTKSNTTYNFEGKNSYTVTVNVRDSKDSAGNPNTSTDHSITVTISLTNVNERPTITTTRTAISVAENQTTVLTYGASDVDASDTMSWSVENTGDGGKFQIGTSSGVLRFRSAPDFETKADADGNNVYDVTVTVHRRRQPQRLEVPRRDRHERQ